ncbi:MAG: hypothetical protein AB1671_03420 [Thermodesulfobacteriota bacterium]|jgi:tryptophan synthase beta subunit
MVNGQQDALLLTEPQAVRNQRLLTSYDNVVLALERVEALMDAIQSITEESYPRETIICLADLAKKVVEEAREEVEQLYEAGKCG